MTSISSRRIAEVLDRLHQEADAVDKPLHEQFRRRLDAASVEKVIGDIVEAENTDLQGTLHKVAGNFLAVSPEFGRFLYACARSCKAKRIVEFGTSMGVSTIYLAAGLRDVGAGGQLVGTELEPSKAERAQAHLTEAGLADLVEIRLGNARETLKPGVGGDIDLLLLDGAFSLYLPVLQVLEPHLKPGTIIVGENAFKEAGGYLDYVRNPENGYISFPLPFDEGRGNEFTIRTK